MRADSPVFQIEKGLGLKGLLGLGFNYGGLLFRGSAVGIYVGIYIN